MMEIRKMTPADDALSVSRIYEESWRYAYRDILPHAYLASLPAGLWARHLVVAQTLLCLDDGKPVGTATFCPARLPRYAGWGELVSIYFLPAYMGKGHGAPLLQAAMAELREQGFARVYLWVLEENKIARRFYEKAGFQKTDDFLDDIIGGKAVREVRYAAELIAPCEAP